MRYAATAAFAGTPIPAEEPLTWSKTFAIFGDRNSKIASGMPSVIAP